MPCDMHRVIAVVKSGRDPYAELSPPIGPDEREQRGAVAAHANVARDILGQWTLAAKRDNAG